jgi:hypothetical protein
MQLVIGGQTAISINGVVGPYFRNKRGVRQGDPLSPMLFDLVVDALALVLRKANGASHIKGVISHLLPGWVTHLQYADDTMILIEKDDTSIANLKFILICFELLSGLKINYHKSEVIVMGVSSQEQTRVANLLNWQEGAFPLGIWASQLVIRSSPLLRWNLWWLQWGPEWILGRGASCLRQHG